MKFVQRPLAQALAAVAALQAAPAAAANAAACDPDSTRAPLK